MLTVAEAMTAIEAPSEPVELGAADAGRVGERVAAGGGTTPLAVALGAVGAVLLIGLIGKGEDLTSLIPDPTDDEEEESEQTAKPTRNKNNMICCFVLIYLSHQTQFEGLALNLPAIETHVQLANHRSILSLWTDRSAAPSKSKIQGRTR